MVFFATITLEMVMNVLTLVFFKQCTLKNEASHPEHPTFKGAGGGSSTMAQLREECQTDNVKLGFTNAGEIAYTLPIFDGVLFSLPFLLYFPLFIYMGLFFKRNLPNEYKQIKNKIKRH